MYSTNKSDESLLIKDRTALVLYGSETGNAEDVAGEIQQVVERLRFQTTVLDLNSVDIVSKYLLYKLCKCLMDSYLSVIY